MEKIALLTLTHSSFGHDMASPDIVLKPVLAEITNLFFSFALYILPIYISILSGYNNLLGTLSVERQVQAFKSNTSLRSVVLEWLK